MDRVFIGCTSHIGYFSKFTSMTLNGTYKIYIVPIKKDIQDVSKLEMIIEGNGNVEIKYDGSAYPNGENKNFKLLVNGECIHVTKYINKYLVEFNGAYTLKEESFVDH